MKYVFGPVPSRRLGRSLGVDPVPFKTCNWNCVYCQLGRTSPLRSERAEHAPVAAILDELGRALETLGPGTVDLVTFCGSGETTLHAGLGALVRGAKALTPIPVAVITNGVLLERADVRADVAASDAVLPTLDAGTEAVFRRINRPTPGLTLARLVDGLVAFRREYHGRLWVEVMLVKGVNDGEQELRALAAILARVAPDAVHLNRPVRPPAEPWVEAPDDAAVARAAAILGATARIVGAETPENQQPLGESVEDAVEGVLSRHPMDLGELVETLKRWSPGEVGEALARLAAGGRIRTVTRMSRRFWSAAGALYGEDRS